MVSSGQSQCTWLPYAEGVAGSRHQLRDEPSQDSCKWGSSPYGVVIAVADGHGSASNFNSMYGSEFASLRAVGRLLCFAATMQGEPLEHIRRYAHEELGRDIVRAWVRNVRQHAKKDKRANELPPAKLLSAYGTTLLAVLATKRYLLYFQLGDGDILRVAANGSVSRPISKHNLIGDETYSLCMRNAWLHASIYLEPLDVLPEPDTQPELIVLATDGYANSFNSDDDFLRVGPDILRLIQRDGWEAVKSSLAAWLKETTQMGSGDDITVGLLWRTTPRSASEV